METPLVKSVGIDHIVTHQRHRGCCCHNSDSCCIYCTESPVCSECGDWITDGKCDSACGEEDDTPCSHSSFTEYQWEWDSGYGRQEMMTGHRCIQCGKKNSWPGSSQLWS